MILKGALTLAMVVYLATLGTSFDFDVDCIGNSGQGCDHCINDTRYLQCAWCPANDQCLRFNRVLDMKILPGCTGNFFATNCVVNHELVITGIGVGVAVVVLVTTMCLVWCCCCRGNKARREKYEQEQMEYQNERDQIAAKHDSSRAERQEKLDSIRQKYGLKKSNPYEQF